jgi:hypothetical protein
MDRRSTEGRAGEWRQQGFSGQGVCRTSTGAASRGGRPIKHKKRQPRLPFCVGDKSRLFDAGAVLVSARVNFNFVADFNESGNR